jgi:hypothetical protein
MVLALLVCALTVHGNNHHDPAHPSAAADTAVSAAAAVLALPATPRADARHSHEPPGDDCGEPSSVQRPSGTLTPALMAVTTVPPATADDKPGRAVRPPSSDGRSLLLLECVCRT